ncbi:copper resistance D family protein [Paenibacillus chungangensis]|uniref:Copper resistance D family protein n=1 Tax=Paenibacillus chungangensis TaxID=696535 RepID=A0ABW3HVP1_9BACL
MLKRILAAVFMTTAILAGVLLPMTLGADGIVFGQDAAAIAEAAGEHDHHADGDGDHSHFGGQRLMVVMRIAEVVAAAAAGGFLFFRYVLYRKEKLPIPGAFTPEAERYLMFVVAMIWLMTGWARIGMLMDQFDGIPFGTIVASTTIGKMAVIRLGGALLLALLTFAPEREKLWANPLKGVTVIGLIVTFPLTGHAYAVASGAAAAVSSHALHIAFASVWAGGLAGLWAVSFGIDRADQLNRLAVTFSRWALVSIVIIIGSGVWLAIVHLSSWRELWMSEYGIIVLTKSVLMLLIVFIGILHRSKLMGLLDRGQERSFLTAVRMEIVAAVALFLLAGWLSSTSPAPVEASALGDKPFYWHEMGEEAHMTLRMNEGAAPGEQLVRLYVWLPEGQGAPKSIAVGYRSGDDDTTAEVNIPMEPMPEGQEKTFDFPGFTKYSYSAEGGYLPPEASGEVIVKLTDANGKAFHYKRQFP